MAKYSVHICNPPPVMHGMVLSGDQNANGKAMIALVINGETAENAVGLSGDQRKKANG